MLAQEIIGSLQRIVGNKDVLTAKEDLIPYSFDGTAAFSRCPAASCSSNRPKKSSDILKLANEKQVPVVTRGSGTGLSGGSLPVARLRRAVHGEDGQNPGARPRQSHDAGLNRASPRCKSPMPRLRPDYFIRLIPVR